MSAKSEEAVVALLGQKIGYGSIVKVDALEELLGVKRDETAFGFLISALRHHLYSHGYYLSGEGVSETGCFEVLAPAENQWVAKVALARTERDLTGKQTLLINTKTADMSDVQRRRHEITLRELSLKLQAMRRAQESVDRLARHGRKLRPVEQPSGGEKDS
jgi:hypothetical protein